MAGKEKDPPYTHDTQKHYNYHKEKNFDLTKIFSNLTNHVVELAGGEKNVPKRMTRLGQTEVNKLISVST